MFYTFLSLQKVAADTRTTNHTALGWFLLLLRMNNFRSVLLLSAHTCIMNSVHQ